MADLRLGGAHLLMGAGAREPAAARRCVCLTIALVVAAAAGTTRAAHAGPPRPGGAVTPAGAVLPWQGGVQALVDGIAAVVNDEVISIGEVRRAALMLRSAEIDRPAGGCGGLGVQAVGLDLATGTDPGGTLAEPGVTELEAALECLIDGTLVFREARRFPQLGVTEDRVHSAYQRLQDSFPDPQAFHQELARIGLTPDGVIRDLRRQLLVSVYIESRFRSTLDVAEAEARSYYQEELAPDMRARGIETPPYEEVAEQYVLPILRERQLNRRVESWLAELRARASIRRVYPRVEPPG